MTIITRQFRRPHGPLGRLVGRGMARGGGDFSRWVVRQIPAAHDGAERVLEIGPGPGVGLAALLERFPAARVWGVDLSPAMLAQARSRNAAQDRAGRLTLIQGGVPVTSVATPADVVMANHVLYYWLEPTAELGHIRRCLRPGGLLALGYQLRENLPPLARRRLPRDGHRLYDTDGEVTALLDDAGFTSVDHRVMGPPAAPHGRVALAVA